MDPIRVVRQHCSCSFEYLHEFTCTYLVADHISSGLCQKYISIVRYSISKYTLCKVRPPYECGAFTIRCFKGQYTFFLFLQPVFSNLFSKFGDNDLSLRVHLIYLAKNAPGWAQAQMQNCATYADAGFNTHTPRASHSHQCTVYYMCAQILVSIIFNCLHSHRATSRIRSTRCIECMGASQPFPVRHSVV